MENIEVRRNSDEFILKPYYVYVLVDTLNNNEIFYVGKGTSQRGYDHLKDASKTDIAYSPKISRIKSIFERDAQPLVRVVGRFSTEKEAFAVESVLIHWVYGFNSLSNEQPGHGARYVRPKNMGLEKELHLIDIPSSIKVMGSTRSGYLKERIENHVRLNHAEMMQDLFDYLAYKDIPLLSNGVIGIEGGRYLAITIRLKECANLVLQITDSEKHSIIPNLRPLSESKEERDFFTNFLKSTLNIVPKNGGRYLKLDRWKKIKINAEEHEEIYKFVESTIYFFKHL
jgi:hypothetical protein|tara:strand:+ start:1993 stop:2847 length:855 start_codon:yes stop_codon:yes gene_type:complete